MTTFKEALKAVLPHAASDTAHYELCGVHVTSKRVVATDRYTLARAIFDTPMGLTGQANWHPSLNFIMPLDIVKRVVASKSEVSALTSELVTFTDGSTIAFTAYDADYPNVEKLFDDFKPGEVGMFAVNPVFLARYLPKFFPKQYGSPSIHVEPNAGAFKPMRVTVPGHDWFTSLIVPLKVVV